jgi:type II secretory pathway component GspD/PulD (secretin)
LISEQVIPVMKRAYRRGKIVRFVQGSLCLFLLSLPILAVGGVGEGVGPLEQECGTNTVMEPEGPPAAVEPAKRYVKIEFDNADILAFIKFMAEVTGKNFVVDPKVKGKVTIVAPKEISVDEAYEVFLSVLEVHGFTTVRAGSIIKIIPSSEAPGKGIDTQ